MMIPPVMAQPQGMNAAAVANELTGTGTDAEHSFAAHLQFLQVAPDAPNGSHQSILLVDLADGEELDSSELPVEGMSLLTLPQDAPVLLEYPEQQSALLTTENDEGLLQSLPTEQSVETEMADTASLLDDLISVQPMLDVPNREAAAAVETTSVQSVNWQQQRAIQAYAASSPVTESPAVSQEAPMASVSTAPTDGVDLFQAVTVGEDSVLARQAVDGAEKRVEASPQQSSTTQPSVEGVSSMTQADSGPAVAGQSSIPLEFAAPVDVADGSASSSTVRSTSVRAQAAPQAMAAEPASPDSMVSIRPQGLDKLSLTIKDGADHIDVELERGVDRTLDVRVVAAPDSIDELRAMEPDLQQSLEERALKLGSFSAEARDPEDAQGETSKLADGEEASKGEGENAHDEAWEGGLLNIRA